MQMDEREELRRLINVIERGSASASIEQAIDDIRTFANTASFLANKLDTRLKRGSAKPKAGKRNAPKAPRIAAPKAVQPQNTNPQPAALPNASSNVVTQADYDRLKPITPQSPVGAN
jgi:hypothetical protein